MNATTVLHILDLLAAVGVPAWLDGGWGVDALFGRITRAHNDLDLILALDDLPHVVAVLVRQEVVLVVMGGVFVVETLSVMIQVISFKLTGRRVFRMAPIHHHFELKGWPEPRVIVRFWIISVILVLFGLATLKLR